MSKLTGNTPYEMINHATGKLANKLQGLIGKHGNSPLVQSLAQDFINWWFLSFDDPEKDSIGREIWDRIDEAKTNLESMSAESESTDGQPMTKLEKAGNAVGNVIGKATGVTTNATIAGATATHQWVKESAAPTIKAGSKEFWKGLKATARATREAYRESRLSSKTNEDDSPY
ncbi:TPA: hypothetical protein ENS27_19080 [bacterium]|nr:hypothetical protein [bacterium]